MAIKFKIPDQYFSIGFGSRMSGADIWVFEIIGSQIVATDHIGVGYASPPLDTDRGGNSDLKVLGYEIGSTYSLVKFKRALNTGDPNDAVISPGLTNIIYSTGPSKTMVKHVRSGRGRVSVPLYEGVHTSIAEDSASSGANVEEAHSIVNFIAWGVLVDIGILAVRLFRGTSVKIWKAVITVQLIHGILMTMVIVMSAVVTGMLLAVNRKERKSQLSHMGDTDFHLINGLIVLALIVFTMVLGVLNKLTLKNYNKPIMSKYTIKWLHKVTGFILYLLAKANVITGALIYDEGKWRVGVCIYLIILFIAHGIIQIYYTYKNSTPNKIPISPYKVLQYSAKSALLDAINQGIPTHQLIAKFPKLKWVTLGNGVYDLTNWIHPGGNFLIQASIGREIGRYFFGNYALEGTKIQPRTHSSLTVSQMQKYCIGKLDNLESFLVSKGTQNEAVSYASNKWKIASVTPVTDTVSEIAFQSQDYQVRSFGKSVSWLGRHFKVSQDTSTSNARLYTTAASLSKANFALRQNIYKYFEDVMNGNKSTMFSYNHDYHVSQDVLPLYVKDYAAFPNSFSHLMHTVQISEPSNQFRIEGPLGRGLELSPSSTGTHCIVCAGTGVLPFVDFLNLFLWKTMYDLIKKTAGIEKAESINVLKIPFDTLFNQMSITFLGGFGNTKEVLGLDIIVKLAELSQKYSLNNFKGMMKGYSDANIGELKGSFTRELLKKVVTTKEEKYYVVGPPKVNEEVPKFLREMGVHKERIVLV